MELRTSRKPWNRKGRVVVIALVVALVAVLWALVEARIVFVERSVVVSPDLPAELDGTRIAFASDFHAGSLLGRRHMVTTLAKVQRLDADLIILGGDFGGGGKGGYKWFYSEAGRLEAPLGVFAVLGNHEGGGGRATARRELAARRIRLLENDNIRVGAGGVSFRLAGVDDYLTGSPDVPIAAEGIPRGEFAVLVSHNPDTLPDGLNDTDGAFDLVLSGHNHGGQVTLFGLWAPVLPSKYGQRFRGGWVRVEGVPVLVSRGAGVYVLPMRFFAPAQVHLIELRRGPASAPR